MEKKGTTSMTNGVILGLILIVLGLVIYFMKIDVNGPVKWLQMIIFAGFIIWAVPFHGKQIDYNATFGNNFAYGFKIAAVATSLLVIYMIVFNLVFPDFKDTALEQARKNMMDKNMPADQIDKAMDITRRFFLVFVIGGLIVINLIIGLIAALIGASITKKGPDMAGGAFTQTGS